MTRIFNTPRLLRGAIVSVDPMSPTASITVFQYNPAELTRTLQAQISGGNEDGRMETLRIKGAPRETISLNVEIDAADQLEIADPTALTYGIYPQLNALEMMIYPKIPSVIANTLRYKAGSLEILPEAMPLTLFIWGGKRVLPVRIGSFSISEQAYDARLNPIRAEAKLELQVLNYSDLMPSNSAYYLFLAHQAAKEAMANLNNLNNTRILIGG